MRLGCNSLIRDPNDPSKWVDVDLVIGLVRELGLDLIDLQLDRGLQSLDTDYLRSVREECESSGIEIGYAGVGGGFVGVGQDPSGEPVGAPLDDAEMEARISEIKNGIDAAEVLGTPLIRLFAGGIPDRTPDRSALWDRVISAYQRVADYASTRGIRIGLHNHPPAIAPTADDVLQIKSAIDRENVTLILDTGQWHGSPGTNREGIADPNVDFYGYMEQVVPHSAYVRAKIYRIESGSEEWLDYPRIFRILSSQNYDAPVSIVFEDRGNKCTYQEAISLAVTHLRLAQVE
jgi:hydroxypyruvate isomerase